MAPWSEGVRTIYHGLVIHLRLTHASGPFSRLPPLLQLAQSPTAGHREVAFRIFGSVPNLVLDEDIPQMLSVFGRGLKDPEAITVSLACFLLDGARADQSLLFFSRFRRPFFIRLISKLKSFSPGSTSSVASVGILPLWN